MSRVHSRNRCDRCRMNGYLCLCEQLPSLTLKTKIVLLMHYREMSLPTNTANLARLALSNSEIHLRGCREKPLSLASLGLEGGTTAVLFPSDGALELNAVSALNLPRPLTLIVPDGSWRQAKKMVRREGLASSLCLKLPAGAPSSYRLRQAPRAEHLSTYEAIARALGIMEGALVQGKLEALFHLMVERTLWSRGAIRAADCPSGIPAAALAAQSLAGARGSQK